MEKNLIENNKSYDLYKEFGDLVTSCFEIETDIRYSLVGNEHFFHYILFDLTDGSELFFNVNNFLRKYLEFKDKIFFLTNSGTIRNTKIFSQEKESTFNNYFQSLYFFLYHNQKCNVPNDIKYQMRSKLFFGSNLKVIEYNFANNVITHFVDLLYDNFNINDNSFRLLGKINFKLIASEINHSNDEIIFSMSNELKIRFQSKIFSIDIIDFKPNRDKFDNIVFGDEHHKNIDSNYGIYELIKIHNRDKSKIVKSLRSLPDIKLQYYSNAVKYYQNLLIQLKAEFKHYSQKHSDEEVLHFKVKVRHIRKRSGHRRRPEKYDITYYSNTLNFELIKLNNVNNLKFQEFVELINEIDYKFEQSYDSEKGEYDLNSNYDKIYESPSWTKELNSIYDQFLKTDNKNLLKELKNNYIEESNSESLLLYFIILFIPLRYYTSNSIEKFNILDNFFKSIITFNNLKYNKNTHDLRKMPFLVDIEWVYEYIIENKKNVIQEFFDYNLIKNICFAYSVSLKGKLPKSIDEFQFFYGFFYQRIFHNKPI